MSNRSLTAAVLSAVALTFALVAYAGRVSVQTFETTGSTGQCFVRDTVAANGGSWTTCPGGGVSDGDKGDVTVTDGGVTWTVDNDAITYAKMQNVSASDRVLGRDTAGAGDVEELTVGAALDMLSTSSAAVLYRLGLGSWGPTAWSTDSNGAIWPNTDLLPSLGGTTKRWAEVYTAALDNNGGTITVDGDLLPDNDNEEGFGSSFLRWANGAFVSVLTDNLMGSGGSGTPVTADGDIIPSATLTRSLGSVTYWWAYIWGGMGRFSAAPSSAAGYAAYGESGGRAQVSANGGAASNILTAADRCEMWPVGAVFISVSSTSPATSLGCGTWSALATGRTLVGLDSGDTDFDTAEEMGGAKTQTPSAHSGTAVATHGDHFHDYSNVIAHTHTYKSLTASTGSQTHYEHGAIDTSSTGSNEGGVTDSTGITTGTTTAENSDLTHNVTQPSNHSAMSVVQPYLVVYMWKRTA